MADQTQAPADNNEGAESALAKDTTISELKEVMAQYQTTQANQGLVAGTAYTGGRCPSCGYCPTCGRSNGSGYYPYWQINGQTISGQLSTQNYQNLQSPHANAQSFCNQG